MNSRAPTPMQPWAEVQRFAEDGVAVVISKSGALFSYEISAVIDSQGPSPRLARHFHVRANRHSLSLTEPIRRRDLTIAKLVTLAEDFIQGEVQKTIDVELSYKIAREEAQLAKDKPKQKPGLKSLAKRDAALRNSKL